MKLSGSRPKRNNKPAEQAERSAEKHGGRTALIISLAVVAVVLAAAAAGMTYVSGINTIFPNVRVDGYDIGGLSLNETMAFLEEKGYGDVGDAAVTVELPLDVQMTLRTDEVCSETPVSDIAVMAYDTCKGNSSVDNALTYLRCVTVGLELQSERALTVDEAAVRAAVDAAAKEVQLALLSSDMKIGETSISVVKGASGVTVDTEQLAQQIIAAFQEHNYDTIQYECEIQTDAKLDVQALYDTVYAEKADAVLNEDCEIVPETVGVSFDRDVTAARWDAAVYGETVEIPLIFDRPEVTAEALEALLFRDKLSAMSTTLWGSSTNRINNVSKACDSINEFILMPGDEFDYNKALGKRSAANGYLPAGAYSGGQVVQEYGGGICQVSSTLYYCSLYANLKITARTCHYFPVSYLPAGLDATVSWGGPEYRFVNNREYPVKIVAYVSEADHTVTVELWGTDTDGSYVEMTYGTWLVYDEEFPEVAIGYKAGTYRSVFAADGTLLSRKAEANSYYHYHDEDIEWPEETEEPTESAEPTAPVESAVPTDAPGVTGAPEPTASPDTEVPPGEPTPPVPTVPVGE